MHSGSSIFVLNRSGFLDIHCKRFKMINNRNSQQNVPPPGMEPRAPQFQGPFAGPGPVARPEQRQNIPITQPSSLSGTFPFISQKLNGKSKRSVVISSVLGLLILLGGIAFAAWWFLIKSTPDVTLYQVGSQNTTQDIGGGGIIFPRQQLDISYPVAERVVSVLVKAGDQVTPNQPLIQLDATQLNVQIQQAANDVAAAQAFLNSVSASGSAVNIAQAQQQYDLAKNRYNALVAQSSSAFLRNGKLIAPMNGVVTAVNVNPGSVFAADVPLLTIMDESILIIHAKIPLSNLGQVHLGQQATVTPSALPGTSLQGTVSAIIPQADPQTDTFEVWVKVVNTNKMLLPGMSAFVHIQTAGKAALVVPRLAVLDAEGNASVFVVRNQRAHMQHVQVTGRSEDAVFIGGGLAAGDKVVLVGLDTLQDGQLVRVNHTEASM
jgi:RND family efflux transporter MFP subunit